MISRRSFLTGSSAAALTLTVVNTDTPAPAVEPDPVVETKVLSKVMTTAQVDRVPERDPYLKHMDGGLRWVSERNIQAPCWKACDYTVLETMHAQQMDEHRWTETYHLIKYKRPSARPAVEDIIDHSVVGW